MTISTPTISCPTPKPGRFARLRQALILGLATIALPVPSQAAAQTQTIVILRHGERAEGGLGQLSCQGLNRALALPARIVKQFGRPDFLFAPDPGKEKEDMGKTYSYVRPLATIEPTAIAFVLPVDATIGYAEVGKLARRLDEPRYRDKTIVVAWEHHQIVILARDLLAAHGGASHKVPDWGRDDFDGLFVVRITREGATVTSSFERLQQDLDGQPTVCPVPKAAPSSDGH